MGVEWVLIGAIFNDLDNEKGLKNKQSYFSARSWEMRHMYMVRLAIILDKMLKKDKSDNVFIIGTPDWLKNQ